MPSSDVLIVGGGPLGMALALALHRAGIGCSVADARPRGVAGGDRRVLALSHGSRQILERLGVWPRLDVTSIETIHVSQAGGFGRTLLRAADYGLPALGYVLDAGSLAAALEQEIAAQGISVLAQTTVTALRSTDARAVATLTTHGRQHTLEARLVACAEGAVSDDAGNLVTRDYHQQAIVATATIERPHGHIAFERFTAAGPIALLPQGSGYAAIVARAENDAQSLLALDDDALRAWLQQAFGSRVRFAAVGPRAVFPLVLRYRRRPVGSRTVWLGNAAQTLHPVAGQGFNLALRDAWELTQAIARAGEDPGDARLLQRHAASRRLDRAGVIGFTDALVRIFTNHNSLLHHARGAGLVGLDLLPAARDFVARRMMFGARAWL